MHGKKILVVEDEPDIRTLVNYHLAQEHFTVFEAMDGGKAMIAAQREKPDLLILDLMLPDLSGLELCRNLRARPETAQLPILMLTAKAGEADRVVGLEMGADDYLTKPFSPRELVARVKAIFRRVEMRSAARKSELYEKGPLKINFSTYEVSVKGRPVKLTLKEFEILRVLIQNPNHVFTRNELLEGVWGGAAEVYDRTVDVHIRRLRKALEKNDRRPEWVLTVRGVGYKFDETALDR